MNDPKTRDLVDRYLLRVASSEEVTRLDHMRSADPLFNRYVEECEKTFHVIQAARTIAFRKKLESLDRLEKRKRKKGLLLMITMVMCILLFWSWVVLYFSPVALATRSFQRTSLLSEMTLIDNHKELWSLGKNAFLRHEFQLAHSFFSEIEFSTSEKEESTIRWNMLLCEFVQTGPTVEMQKKFQSFSGSTHDRLNEEAICLQQIMQSPLYRLLYLKIFGNSVKLVRPGII
jgi:hypothetical protein